MTRSTTYRATQPNLSSPALALQVFRSGFFLIFFPLLLATLSACTGSTSSDDSGEPASQVLYVESNNPTSGQNSIFAYRRNSDGTLTAISGSPFLTGGTGHTNPTQKLGPNDLDQPIVVSPDKRRLYAVNAGSNSIAVMKINSDGSLTPVAGSPFASGGNNPVSIGLADNRLYVVNKSENGADVTTTLPNYTAFTIESDSKLTPIAGSTFEVRSGDSPSQALISKDKKILFGADFLAPAAITANPPIRSFTINASGTMTPAPGSPLNINRSDTGKAGALGLMVHPTQKILYVGYTQRDQVGVYTYTDDGALTYTTTTAVSGKAPCWIITNSSGSRIYTTNTVDGSVSVLDATNPLAPVEIQKLVLKEVGPLFEIMPGAMAVSSGAFQEALSPDGKNIYVVSQRATSDASYTQGNYLHVLNVASDGTLTEPGVPVVLAVPTTARPHGVVTF
ncbi:MAG: beta-propeller fold lactonase family protein [Rhizobacter sp.]|nr:beta-propeller fold lactonase family protein [Chlorobiales bacterium]